jgi:hypothetical protein
MALTAATASSRRQVLARGDKPHVFTELLPRERPGTTPASSASVAWSGSRTERRLATSHSHCGIADPPHAVVRRCDLPPRIPGRLRLRPALPPRGRAGELPSQTTVSSPSTGSSSSHRWFSSRIVRVPGRSRARCCLTTCLRAQGPGREREGHSRRPARLRCLLRGLPCRYAEVLAPEAFSTALVNLIA